MNILGIHPQNGLVYLNAAAKLKHTCAHEFKACIVVDKRCAERGYTGVVRDRNRNYDRLARSCRSVAERYGKSAVVSCVYGQQGKQHYQRRQQCGQPQGYAISCFFHNNVLRFFI